MYVYLDLTGEKEMRLVGNANCGEKAATEKILGELGRKKMKMQLKGLSWRA